MKWLKNFKALYIPFWLNLYQLINARSENNDTTLHSILVKSIRVQRMNCNVNMLLYIPFWLNLYPDAEATTEEGLQTLHSILVKSIPELKSVSSFQIDTLHSILVKSIPDIMLLTAGKVADFTFHSG